MFYVFMFFRKITPKNQTLPPGMPSMEEEQKQGTTKTLLGREKVEKVIRFLKGLEIFEKNMNR